MERIPAEDWHSYIGHVERYQYAAEQTFRLWGWNRRRPLVVNDIACGVGYGAAVFQSVDPLIEYHGYDRPGVAGDGGKFPGTFHAVDLNDKWWRPGYADVTVCFETLEHVADPVWLASTIVARTAQAIFVSVPVEPTKHLNGHHLHDFTVADIPPLFPHFHVADEWAQPAELSHVWRLERDEPPDLRDPLPDGGV